MNSVNSSYTLVGQFLHIYRYIMEYSCESTTSGKLSFTLYHMCNEWDYIESTEKRKC